MHWNQLRTVSLLLLVLNVFFFLQQTKRKLDDANKRLECLYDKLREQTVSLCFVLFFNTAPSIRYCRLWLGIVLAPSAVCSHMLSISGSVLQMCLCRLGSAVGSRCLWWPCAGTEGRAPCSGHWVNVSGGSQSPAGRIRQQSFPTPSRVCMQPGVKKK